MFCVPQNSPATRATASLRVACVGIGLTLFPLSLAALRASRRGSLPLVSRDQLADSGLASFVYGPWVGRTLCEVRLSS
jgi:hypothetical protein